MISNKELNKMLKENGRRYTLTMYINHLIHLTQKQLDYVLNYKGRSDNNEWNRENKSIIIRNKRQSTVKNS